MKRTFWLVALLTAFSFTMNAQNHYSSYSRLWSKVQKAEKEGKPQTAAGYLRELEEKTLKAGDELEQLVVSENLYENLRKYNWKEANAYYPAYAALSRRVLTDSLESYIVSYADHPRVMMLLYRRLCNNKNAVDRKWNPPATGADYLRIREECRTLLRHKHVGTYKKNIQAMIDNMESTTLSADSRSTMAPAKGVSYNLETRNLEKVDVRVYRLLDDKLFFEGFADLSENLLRKNATLVSLQTLGDFRNEFNIRERRQVKVDFPDPGVYVVYFTSGDDFCCDQVNVSNIAGAFRVRGGSAEVYSADLTSGKPLGKGTVSLYKNLAENNKSSIYSLKRNRAESFSGEGFVPVGLRKELADHENRWQIRIESGNDIYAPFIHVPYSGEPRSVKRQEHLYEQTKLFTDRMLYKPGDSIHFKIICFKAGETKGEVLPGKEAEITIRHSAEKDPVAKQTLVTNDFGSAAGVFTLPEGSKNGMYVIESGYSRLGTVRVEEYKRPSFTLSLEPVTEALAYGDVIRQSGVMRSFAGFSLAGGKVWYRVTRTTHSRTHGRYLGSVELLEGSVISGGDGRFEIVFPASRPDYEGYEEDVLFSDYRITVSATDPQGETHESGITVPVSDIPVDINVLLPDNERFGKRLIVDKDRTKSVTIEGTTLNGSPYRGEGIWRLFAADSSEVCSGRFDTNRPVDFDFASLPSGDYRLEAETEFRGRSVKSSCDVVVLSTDDTRLPFTSKYFYYPVQTEGAIEFVIGTSEEDLYLELELFDDDDRLYHESVHLRNEMRKFRLPYLADYRSAVKMSVFGFRGGEKIDRSYEFKRPGDVKLDVAVETFRDKTTPNTEETMTLRAPEGSELVISIYDVTSDRYRANSFVFTPLREYAYVSRPNISTSIDGYRIGGMFYAKSRAAGASADMMVLESAPARMEEDAMAADDAQQNGDQEQEEAPAFEARKNFSELIAFYPQLQAEAGGITKITYRTSDLLSTYRVLVSAHDKRMYTGCAESEFVVQQELIVQPNVPLFVTEGDRIVLKAKLVNLGRRELRGTAYAEIRDSAGKKLKLKGLESRKHNLLAGAQDEVSWTVEIPGGTDGLKVKIWFAAAEVSDGEEHRMQVVPRTITLTEAASFILGGKYDHKYYEKQLRMKFGAADPKIEYAEYSTLDAVKESLPKAQEPQGQNAISWINQLYINQMRNFVLKDDPADYTAFRANAFSHIKLLQHTDGGIIWFPGMKSNHTLTLYLLEKLGQLRSLGAFQPDDSEMSVIQNAVKYIDSRIETEGSYKNFSPFRHIRHFAVRSLWFDVPMSKSVADVYKRFIDGTEEGWQDISILEKSQLINLMLRAEGSIYNNKGFTKRIKQLRESLRDYAVENPTVGCYFPNAVMPFRGLMNNEIYAHAQLIETFGKLGEKKLVDGIAQWLLLQKHNQAWENTVATTDAVHALVSSKAKDLRLGAVYYTYTTRLEKVKASANEIKIDRTFVRASDGETLEDGARLRVGDEIIVRYRIHNTENRSFVQMRAMRPASFYPRDERSYFTWYGFYREVKPSETNYYWELLPEEYMTVEERFHVQQEGRFNSGLVEIECLYAKEYRGHTDAVTLSSDGPIS